MLSIVCTNFVHARSGKIFNLETRCLEIMIIDGSDALKLIAHVENWHQKVVQPQTPLKSFLFLGIISRLYLRHR